MQLESVIYSLLSNGFQKDIMPILFTKKSLYNNHLLWNKIVNKVYMKKNSTLLMYYAINNRYERFKFILDSGAYINNIDDENQTAMRYAISANGDNSSHKCIECNLKIIEYLCDKNINLNILDNNLENDIFYAIYMNCNIEAFKILCKYDFNINHKNKDNKTAMSLAIEYNNIDMCYQLWKKGADINSVDKDNHTFLMVAINNNDNYEMIEEILKEINNINVCDNSGSALKYAIIREDIKLIKLLISYKANVNSIDNYGFSCLMWAIAKKNVEIVNILCDNKVNINYSNLDMNAIKYSQKLKLPDIEKVLRKRLRNN